MKVQRQKNNTSGFTLIELIVVIVIILILSALLVPSVTKYVQKSKLAKCANQRHELRTQFELLGADEIDIGVAEDEVTLNGYLDGKSAVQYMADRGYCSKDITICPVHNEEYTITISSQDGHREVEFVCPCVDTVKGYLAKCGQVYKENSSTINKREDLIKAMENSFLKVSDSIKGKTAFKNNTKDFYWRPYYLKDGSMVLYAAPKTAANAWENWQCNLLYIDGKIYQSTKTDYKGEPTHTGISDLFKAGSDIPMSEYLSQKKFVEVK